ncbi:MAG: FlgD immunoglobulin-like domain containing protein, partial [Bacteroidales bacterium]
MKTPSTFIEAGWVFKKDNNDGFWNIREDRNNEYPFLYWQYPNDPYYVDIQDICLPKHYSLNSNYPNPFNPTTTIEYSLPEQTDVKLIIYDIKGNTIKQWTYPSQNAGYYSVIWNGTNNLGNQISTGIYF